MLHFIDDSKLYFVSCERSESLHLSDADIYWKDKGLALPPTRTEARVIYSHKAELDAALSAVGYINNYFQTTDDYWLSETYESGIYTYNYYLEMGSGEFRGSFNTRDYSFGVYIK